MVLKKLVSVVLMLMIAAACYSQGYEDKSAKKIIIKFKNSVTLTRVFSNTKKVHAFGGKLEALFNQHSKSYTHPFLYQGSKKKDVPLLQKYVIAIFPATQDISKKIDEIVKDPSVEYAEPLYKYKLFSNEWKTPNDPLYKEQWGLIDVQAEKAWEITKGDPSITVAIIDSGIDYLHPDLKNSIAINSREDINKNGTFEPWSAAEIKNGVSGDFDGLDQDDNGYTDDVVGWEFRVLENKGDDVITPHANPYDVIGHGTSVAGIVSASAHNMEGIAGLAPRCKLLPIAVFSSREGVYQPDIVRGIMYALERDARIVNMSFGGPSRSRLIADIIQYASRKGIVFVAASGNSYSNAINYPAAYDDVLGVTAHQERGIANAYAYGSHVDISAPGKNIVSTLIESSRSDYGIVHATSFASPFVSATAALVLSVSPLLSTQAVYALLKSTADEFVGEDNSFYRGVGKLNTGAAVALAMHESKLELRVDFPSEGESTSVRRPLEITGTVLSPLFVSYSLYYTRYRELSDLESTLSNGNEFSWTPIVENVPYQRYRDVLGVWKIQDLSEGTYTLRLVMKKRDGAFVEERKEYHLDVTPPSILNYNIRVVLYKGRHVLLLNAQFNEPVYTTVYYRSRGSKQAFKKLEMFESVVQKRTGFFFEEVEVPYLFQGQEIETYLEIEDESGLTASTQEDLKILRLNPMVSRLSSINLLTSHSTGSIRGDLGGFISKELDFNRNSINDIIFSDGRTAFLYEWNAKNLSLTEILLENDFYGQRFVDVADINGDGVHDFLVSGLLASGVGITKILTQESSDGRLLGRTQASKIGDVGFLLARTKKDNSWQIISRQRLSYAVLNKDLNAIDGLAVDPAGITRNFYYPTQLHGSVGVCEDFDKDGVNEVLIGNSQGSFFMVEWNGSKYKNIWNYSSEAEGAHSCDVTFGDYFGEKTLLFTTLNLVGSSELPKQNGDVQSVWRLKIWKSTEDNSYQELWGTELLFEKPSEDSYDYVRPRLASSDITGDGKDDLLVSLGKDIYLIEADMTSQTFRVRWLFSSEKFIHQIGSIDVNGDKEKDLVLYEKSDQALSDYSLSIYTIEPQAIAAPIGVRAEALGFTSIKLSWNEISNTVSYNILRSSKRLEDRNYSELQVIARGVTGTLYHDNMVQAGFTYQYAVQAVSEKKQSSPSFPLVETYPSDMLSITNIRYNRENHNQDVFQILFSLHLKEETIVSENFRLLGSSSTDQKPRSLTLSADKKSVFLFFPKLETGDYHVSIGDIRATNNIGLETKPSPFTSISLHDSYNQELRLESVEIVTSKQVKLIFSDRLNKFDSENLTNYTLVPDIATVVEAKVLTENKRAVLLYFSQDVAKDSYGYENGVLLKVKNIRSEDGSKRVTGSNDSHERVVMVFPSIPQKDVANTFVYPNPWIRGKSTEITFSNLNREGRIQIFTAYGKLVHTIEYNTGTGSAQWSPETVSPARAGTGVYIYRVVTKEGKSNVGKLSIIR